MTSQSKANDQTGGVFIALGSNTALTRSGGSPLEGAELFLLALRALERVGIVTLKISNLWSSPAWPDPNRGDFFNAVAEVACVSLNAQEVMRHLLCVEHDFGRIRSIKNAGRTLDLDLIDYRGEIRQGDDISDLILPHPRMHQRSFVLEPLQEIAPKWVHPVTGMIVDELVVQARQIWPSRRVGEILKP